MVIRAIIVFTACWWLNWCPAETSAKPNVYVTCYPLMYFAHRISDHNVTIQYPVSTGLDPVFMALRQAQSIEHALSALLTQKASVFKANYLLLA
jgi:ABC-type Zn uptake system ZnuABC Zn-binding protein ZnuA